MRQGDKYLRCAPVDYYYYYHHHPIVHPLITVPVLEVREVWWR